MREIRTYGLNGDLRKRSQRATAPEDYQCAASPDFDAGSRLLEKGHD
jgi:hypothetical protein